MEKAANSKKKSAEADLRLSPSAYSLVVIRSYHTMACFFEKSREKLKKTGKEAKNEESWVGPRDKFVGLVHY